MQWRQRGGSNVKTTTTAAEQTYLGINDSSAARQHENGSDRDVSGEDMNFWKRLWQDGSNSCDNMVAEPSWLGFSVKNRNVSGKTASTYAARIWLTGSGDSGGREAAATLRQQ